MKVHTNDFKNKIKEYGRELDSIITYELDGETIELGNEQLNSVSPHYEGAILKSVMKQLDIESNVDIPLNTIINYQLGVKVRDEDVEDYRDNYDYINFGNYVVFSSEKQEDTNSYKIICYDKMLYSMVDYESMDITYPISIRDYISAICNKLGLEFKSQFTGFANYDKEIQTELYLDSQGNTLGYTFRDVLDELAQATASTICINEEDDELEIRYINTTSDIINEEYLKNINVNFGEQYGPINSIVLSRSGGSDNVYLSDEISVETNGLCEIKISDNQIMNWNDRSDYLPDILYRLNGLQYYLNDFSSTGIGYYNLCDRYSIEVGENTYSCIMFNDEINVTQGLEENVHTEMPEESETDYTKADKTDRKINQTYLIVDKQNGAIEGMASQITDQNEEIASIRLQYNELISKISDIADITTSGESSYASVNLVNVNTSQPISIKIYPINENIDYLYPYSGLYPSSSLYPKSAILRFTNTTTNEVFNWYLPTSLWYYNSNIYDELELSYGDGTNSSVIVTRKCAINSNHQISALTTATTETYDYPTDLVLTDGDYTISLINNNVGYLYVQLMAKNIYTTQFYTKAETNSIIDQTANSIDLSVNTKLSNYSNTAEMNSAINLKANEITSSVEETYATKTTTNQLSSRITQNANSISAEVTRATDAESTISGNLELKIDKNDNNQIVSMLNASANEINITGNRIKIQSNNFELSKTGSITATSGKIGNWNITGNNLYSGSGSSYVRLDANANVGTAIWCGAESSGSAPFRVTKAGALTATNATINGTITASTGRIGDWTINSSGITGSYGGVTTTLTPRGFYVQDSVHGRTYWVEWNRVDYS